MLALEKTRDFFFSKRKRILLGLASVGAGALLVVGAFYYLAQRNEQAKDEISQALRIYRASVNIEATGQTSSESSELSFKSAREKYEKALAEFQKVGAQHDSRPAGKIAKYYAALCLKELKRNKEAIALLEPLCKEKSDYGALALVASASVYEDSGDLAKATEIYKQIVQSSSPVAPKNINLMHLARLYEQQHKADEAVKVYQQVIKDYPGSSFLSEAEQRLKQIPR